jgi:hypothetical protein
MTPMDLLEELARGLHTRTKASHLYDPDVAREQTTTARSDSFGPVDIFLRRMKTNAFGRPVHLEASEFIVRIEVRESIAYRGFSVNRASLGWVPTEKTIGGRALRVYAERKQRLEGAPKDDALDLVDRIIRSPRDSVHFYGNCVVVYVFKPGSVDAVIERIGLLMQLADLVVDHTPEESMVLPAEFAPLQDVAERWAVSDDVDRGDALSEASDDDLQHLVDAVSPYFDKIGALGDPAPDEASLALFWVSVAADEAIQELLTRRSGATRLGP